MKSELFVLLPNDTCCSLQSFAAIELKTKTSSQLKCTCINDGATLSRVDNER